MTETPTGDSGSRNERPTESMREVLLWVVVFLLMVAVAFYCAQLVEELTGRKSFAKIALVAIAFAASMLVRGGVWLSKRLRRNAKTSQNAAPVESVEHVPEDAAQSSGSGGMSGSAGDSVR